ncbi:response regulator receiver protein [Actinomadura sp. CNU-125]|uniref:response regulator receiver protein n=1 Tax=Actinomadura sp. CNU-125 TaxID=1904961 RepID=UPI000961178E|nr:response regulator receiver protein [Actinomadura sp. CNU-125]OLT12532.1 response regulator receiver protein [Actinomadura sp. CNU-125]
MSSGVEADIALDAAVVLSLGMNRVLGRAGGLAGRGAEALAALAEGRAEARAAALAEAATRERALREAVERNARIAALTETRGRFGAHVRLPAPLDLGEQPAEELTAWCAATDRALDEAERALSDHLAAEVTAQIFAASGEGLATDLERSEDVPRADGEDVRRTLARVMARLLPDAGPAEREAVAEAARLLASAATAGEAEGVLQEVRLRIQDANRRTRELREAERLRAAEADAAAQAEAERRYVLDSITAAFEDLGYEVESGFETLTASDGTMVLTKGAWPDHSVRMRVDAAQVRASMTRERPAESEDDRRVDAEREAEWCAAFEAARARLAEAGIRSDVGWRLDPGVRELPVTTESRHTRGRAERRERHRSRDQ